MMSFFGQKEYYLILLFITLISLLRCVSGSENITETCFFNKPSKTVKPQKGEYGVYITRKSECAMIKFKAAIYDIPSIGSPDIGVAMLPHNHKILLDQPYNTREVAIYNISCPGGQFAYFRLLSMEFEPDSCSDYLLVNTSSSGVVGICGVDINSTATPITERISHLLFRSDNHNRNGRKGFTGFLQCFDPQHANLEGCSSGSSEDLTVQMQTKRRRRRRRRRNVNAGNISWESYLPKGQTLAVFNQLSSAVFNVKAKGVAGFSNSEIEMAQCHAQSCNPVLRATAMAILNYTNTTNHQSGCVSVTTTPTTAAPIEISTATPTEIPTATPTEISTATPTEIPTATPTEISTATPTEISTATPTEISTATPIEISTATPTEIPTATPIEISTATPTEISTATPTEVPTTTTITTTPGGLITPPQDENNARCENITKVPMCASIGNGYQYGYFPNVRNQNPSDAIKELNNFKPLIANNCSQLLVHLLCSLYAPFCYVDQNNRPQYLRPCVNLCLEVRRTCEPVLKSINLQWPPHLNCDSEELYRPGNDPLAYCLPNLRNSTTPSPPSSTPTPTTSATPTTPQATPTTQSPNMVRPAVMRGEFTCSTMRFIPICSNVGWTSVSFPNFRNHRTQAEAQRELRDFLPLINNNCSNAIVHFLCSIYAPYCDTDYPQLRLRTCKELCQHVRNDCEDNLNSFGYSWPEHLNCNNSTLFPLNASGLNFCPTDIHALTIPSIP